MVEPMVMTMVMSANTNCTVDGQGMCVVHRGQDDDNNIDDGNVDDDNLMMTMLMMTMLMMTMLMMTMLMMTKAN